MSDEPREVPREAVRIERCPVHGIAYNAAVDDGCVRCRREGGEPAGPATGSVAVGTGRESPVPAAVSTGGLTAPASLGAQAGIALGLVLGTGLLLYGAHTGIVASVEAMAEGPAFGTNALEMDPRGAYYQEQLDGAVQALEELNAPPEGHDDEEWSEAGYDEYDDPGYGEGGYY